MNAGIDHLAVYVPNQYITLDDLAAARNVQPKKYALSTGGQVEMAVPSPAEDVVTLAANAARRVLHESGVSPKDVGLLIVGTESAVDRSKPTASIVHDLVGISKSCRVFDIVHACIGATYGVLTALDWLQNPNNKWALVISSDIAKYGLRTSGEPTQGAGAVAMLLCRDPRLMRLQEIGAFSTHVYDFWKPLYSEYPVVDGLYSAQCYLDALGKCLAGKTISSRSAFLFHVPFLKMVRMAHGKVGEMLDREADLNEHFERNVAPSLIFPSRIGNIYTGSLWLSLASLVENLSPAETGKFDGCYLFSYGSGCGSELLRGEFAEGMESVRERFNLGEILNERRKISIDEYEQSYGGEKQCDWAPSRYCYFRFDGLKNDARQYSKCKQQ